MNIVNVKSKKPFDVYCGRRMASFNLKQSKWANPFVIGKHGTRDEVIEKYRLWINCQPDLLSKVNELKGKTLGCWCDYPEQNCHCSILIEMAESKYILNWFSNMKPFDEPFVYQGVKYYTPENFYQAMKIPKEKIELRAEIAAMSSFSSKTAIRNKEKYPWREDWNEEIKLKVMTWVLAYKFNKTTSFGKRLGLTEDWEITEWNNWGDTYWGKDIRTLKGENNLGRILMRIRNNNK